MAYSTLAVRTATIALALACGAVSAASAQSVEAFYKERQITIYVAAGAGGPFGLRANLLTNFLGRHVPGKPAVVAQYMPGAGGRKAANYVYNAAPKDGTAIALLFYNTALSYRLQPRGAQFDPLKFHWLGSQTPIYAIGYVWHTAPATTIEAMKKTPIVFASTGATSPTGMYPELLNSVAGTKIRIVRGYQGVADFIKAAESGEVHGGMSGWDALVTNYGDRLREKKIIPVVHFTPRRHPDLKDVPLVAELAAGEEDRRIAAFMAASTLIGHTNAAAPGVPADRVTALIDALAATYRDPEAIALAGKAGVPVEPVSAAEVRKAVETVMNAPDALVERAKKATGFSEAADAPAGGTKKGKKGG